MKIHSHSAVLAVAFQCWRAGKEEIWGLWLRACFITTDPKELCKAMLKIQTRCAGPSLAEEQTQSWQRWSHLGKTNPHDASVYHVGHLDAGILVRERLGLDVCQGSSRGSKKLKPLSQKYIKEPHDEDAKEPLPTCPGHRPWPQQWSKGVSLSHAHKVHWEEKSTTAEQIPPRAPSDSGLLRRSFTIGFSIRRAAGASHEGRSSSGFNFSPHPPWISFPFIFNLNFNVKIEFPAAR